MDSETLRAAARLARARSTPPRSVDHRTGLSALALAAPLE